MSRDVATSTPNSKRRTGTPGAHLLPSNWTPRFRTVARLASRVRLSAEDVLRKYLDTFKQVVQQRGFMYRDWDAAFSACVRKDWFGVRRSVGSHE